MHVDWQKLKRYVTLKIFHQGKDIKSILIFVNEKGNEQLNSGFHAEKAVSEASTSAA